MAGAAVIAVVGDMHAGSTLAVCPPKIKMDDGGTYLASRAQRWLFDGWRAYWKRVAAVRKEVRADAFYQLFNGDAVDGNHHGTTQILSANPNAQSKVLTDLVAIPLAMNPDHIVVVRGTEVHVGNSGSSEEKWADGLKRDKRPIICDKETDSTSWWHFRARINGVLIDVTHHGRTGQREHTRGGAAVLHAHDILMTHVKAGDEPPALCLRQHYHRFNDSFDACQVRVVTGGAWQLATGYVKKISADTLADIGGLIIVVKNGKYTVEKVQFKAERGAIWTPGGVS